MEHIDLIAGIISFIAYSIYIYSIPFGNTRPSKSSWWILTVVWSVLLISSLSLSGQPTFAEKWNAVAGAWISVAYIVGSLIIAILTIWWGSKDPWGPFDWLCAISAAISVVLLFILKDPLLSLIAAIIADLFGVLPTIKNAWKYPSQEHFGAWFLETFAGILALTAVTKWTFDHAGISDWSSPVYLVLANGIITAVILIRKRSSKAA